MTKIGIIGATGAAGKEITKEAVVRGLETTAIVRNLDKAKELFTDSVSYLVKDAFALTKEDLQDFDVIIDAYAPSDVAKAYLHVDLATRLIAFFRTEKSPRLFFILGAGSLSNGKEGHVLDDLENMMHKVGLKSHANKLKSMRYYLLLKMLTGLAFLQDFF